ncbi:Aspartic proteinase NANA, chloroplast [Thalictrum thalictroides]|uniref:Aspartic proteinase NANA, chloroplast n=1 Tax=Thalictrum thalictroides TaxID=46969 RepID=A0A7J6WCC0_THATH|nr:Aspartic proteinase NANA, chloroplast [Thalictrum thalictroides]
MSLLLLPFITIFFNGFFSFSAFGSKTTMQFELIHRHSVHELSPPKNQFERVQELVQIDNHRIHMISQTVGRRRKDLETKSSGSGSAAAIPLHSGAYSGTGQYFVQFRVGTPSQKFLLVADTGSDLTWMNCRFTCHNCPRRSITNRRVFHAHRSLSFKIIPCSSEMCLTLPFSLTLCTEPKAPCNYDYRYSDGSSARGIFANETVSVALANGRKMKLHNVVIGCSSSIQGSSFLAADGVLGLGYSASSFVVKAKEKFGGKFSYCLVDHLSSKNVSSYLTFGHNSIENYIGSADMQYTQLALSTVNGGFYQVNVAGISVGGVMLDIPINVWDVSGEGGVIIDSGSSLTYLAEPAYNVVMDALKLPLIRSTKQIELNPFEFCFNSINFDESLVPKLVIHFADSARFEPPVKSYVIDVAKGVKCFGFMSNSWPGLSIIGNIMQQNFMWEFDTVNKMLGFAPSGCAKRS